MARKEIHHKQMSQVIIWGVAIGCALGIMFGSFYLLRGLLADDGGKRERQIQMVTMVKPPPPPQLKEKPPEPEKKEEIVEEKLENIPQENEEQAAEPASGADLGIDAEGSGGGDAFGLQAKKGGRSLIGGGEAGYSWYTKSIGDELQRLVNNFMQKKDGAKDDNLKTEIQISLDDSGRIVDLIIIRPSGSTALDDAVKQAAESVQLAAPIPYGMSRVLRFRIRSKG